MTIKCLECGRTWDEDEDTGLLDGQCPWCGFDVNDTLKGGENGRKKILDLDL